MKTHATKLLNKECMLVELPENYKVIEALAAYRIEKDSNSDYLEFDKFNYKLKGFLSELTDDDVEPLVFKVMQGQHYKNYAEREKPRPDYTKLWCKTPLESFFSALEAEGLYVNGNPFGENPDNTDRIYLKWWHEAEPRTFDKTITLLLIKN